MEGRGDPAVVIDGAMAARLEILDVAGRGRGGVVERVEHADAGDRLLRDPVDLGRRLDAGRLIDRRDDVDHVVELRAQAALLLDVSRPGDDHAVARPAEMRGTRFIHWNGDEPAQAQPTG